MSADNLNKTGKRGKAGNQESAGKEKHCICESRDYTTLMICCDYCAIWYHAKCMHLTKMEVDRIENYACKKCQKSDKKTFYKKETKKGQGKRKQSMTTTMETKPVKKANKETGAVKEEVKDDEPASKKRKKSIGIVDASAATAAVKVELEASSKNAETLFAVKPEPLDGSSAHAQPPPIPKNQQIQEKHPKLRCANCIGCFRDKDCGKCVTCVQGNGKLCVQRVCVQVEELYREMQEGKIKIEPTDGKEEKIRRGKGRPKQSEEPVDGRKRRRGGGCHQSSGSAKEDVSAAAQLNKLYNNWMRSSQKAGNRRGSSAATTQHQKSVPPEFEDRQCQGPGCVSSVRPGSRYCSEACGFALAKLRLKTILPQRMSEYYQTVPANQTVDMQRVERLEGQLEQMQKQMGQLEQWKENVHNFIEAIKTAHPSGEKTRNDDEALVVGCPVCSGEYPMREISKHMQTCYVRSERQTTYGTDYKMPNNHLNLYCDAHNKINDTYCKRLRYACAEHYKDEYDLKICGCPLDWFKKGGASQTLEELFLSPEAMMADGAYCQEKRKSCRDHMNWIQTAFSMIDNERMNLVNRMEELNEQRALTRNMLRNRGDVLTLLTSRTRQFTQQAEQQQQ